MLQGPSLVLFFLDLHPFLNLHYDIKCTHVLTTLQLLFAAWTFPAAPNCSALGLLTSHVDVPNDLLIFFPGLCNQVGQRQPSSSPGLKPWLYLLIFFNLSAKSLELYLGGVVTSFQPLTFETATAWSEPASSLIPFELLLPPSLSQPPDSRSKQAYSFLPGPLRSLII